MTADRLQAFKRGFWPILFLTLLVLASLPGAASGAFTLADEKKLGKEFFDKLNQKLDTKSVKYDVVTNYGKLMEIVGAPEHNLKLSNIRRRYELLADFAPS